MGKRVGVAIAAVGLVALAIAPARAALTIPDTLHTKDSEAVITAPVTRVVVNVDAGDVRITPGTRTSVTHHERWNYAEPKVEEGVSNGVLTVKVTCINLLPQNNCGTDIVIVVPTAVSTQVDVGAGDIDVRGLHGDSALHGAAGDVVAIGVAADQFSAQSGAGSVNVALASAPSSTRVTSSAGDVNLAVPVGTYDVAASSGVGHVTIKGVTVQPGAPRKILARSSAGDVTVTGR